MAIWRGWEYWDDTPYSGGGGPMFQFADDASRIERPIQFRDADVGWGQLPYIVRDFLGDTTYTAVGGTYVRLNRLNPHYYGLFLRNPGGSPRTPWLYAKAIQRMEGKSVQGQLPLEEGPYFGMALCRLTYVDLVYDVREDDDPAMHFVPIDSQPNPLSGGADEACLGRNIIRIIRPMSRMISIPRAIPKWVLESGDTGYTSPSVTPGPTVFEGIAKPEPGDVLEYTWCQVPREVIPRGVHRAAYGKINQYAFDGIYPAQTLLCDSPEIIPHTSPTGRRVADIKYRFHFIGRIDKDGNVRGWNHQLRVIPRTSGTNPLLDYRQITMDGTPSGDSIHRLFDFADLFRGRQPA